MADRARKLASLRLISFMLMLSFSISSAFASEQYMEIKTTGAPAIDLLYQGKAIDRDQAAELFRRGVDLSKLDPIPNDAWKPTSLPVSNADQFNYPPEGAILDFKNDLAPKGNYRGQVEYNGNPFRIIVDMDNHQHLMNGAMLRKLGFPVDMPRRYRNVTLRFPSAEAQKNFVENFAFETGFSRDRWIVKSDDVNFTVTLKDVNLEYPRIDVQQLYYGNINTDWIAGRRAMRSLIIPLMLLDMRFSDSSINIFSWEFSRILANRIVLNHPSAEWFKETTFEDAKWIARKIGAMSKEDLKAIVDEAALPSDISALLLEKITARRNQMVQMFGIDKELPSSLVALPYSTKITIGDVKKGKALKQYYDNYAQGFTFGDPDSPLRWKEIRHYVKMESIAQGIRVLTDKINKELQILTVSDGIDQHKKDFIEAVTEHFANHPNDPYVVPLKPWVQPLAGFSTNASRSLVTGTYYGSESKAQIVDNLSVGASIGAFGGIDGRTYLQNFGFSGNVSYQRTYTHVRPLVSSLEDVKKEKWKKLFVPGFMKGTASLLKWKNLKQRFELFREKFYEGQTAWLSKRESIKNKYCTDHRVAAEECTFDKFGSSELNLPDAIDTTELYKKIIGTTVPEGRDIPAFSYNSEKPAKLPDDLEDTAVLGTLTDFLNDIRDNEVYTITDSFMNQISPQVQIPLTTFMGTGIVDMLGQSLYGKIAPSVGVSVTGEWAIVKRLMFMRKGDSFEVYDTKMNTRAWSPGINFTAWIELAKISAKRKGGDADTTALMMDLSTVTDSDKSGKPEYAKDRKKILNSLADLFIKNESDTAEEFAPPYAIHHDLKGKLRSAKILKWNWANYAETNRVKLTPPKDPRYNAEESARTLYSARKMSLSGSNTYGLIGQVVSKAVGVGGLLDPGTNMNPSGSFLGSSNWSQVRAEAEVTTAQDFKPTLTFEDHYSGWYLSKDKLLKILDRLQSKVLELNANTPIFRRDVFESTETLQAYDIRSSTILYPTGVAKLREILLGPKTRRELFMNILDMVDTDDYRKRCKSFFDDRSIEPELASFEKLGDGDSQKAWNRCIQPWMRKIMRHVKRAPGENDREGMVRWLTDTVFIMNKHVDFSKFLARIGKENFFMQVKVSGFRTKDENGDRGNVDDGYVTDTIGSVQTPISLGAFRDLKVYTKGVEWSISDYELQSRYFGDGL